MINKPKIGQLRVWHVPNPGTRLKFQKEIDTIDKAKEILHLIANYDLCLGDIIFANAQGLEVYVGEDVDYETNEGWVEWENEEGQDISVLMYE